MGCAQCLLYWNCGNYHFRYYVKENKTVCRRSCTVCYGTTCLPLANCRKCIAQYVGTRLVLYQKSRHNHFAFHNPHLVCYIFWIYRRHLYHAFRRPNRQQYPCNHRKRHFMVVCSSWLGQLAGSGCFHYRSGCKKKILLVHWVFCMVVQALSMQISQLPLLLSADLALWYSTFYVPLVLQQWVQSKEKCIMRNGLRLQLLINVCLPMQLLW